MVMYGRRSVVFKGSELLKVKVKSNWEMIYFFYHLEIYPLRSNMMFVVVNTLYTGFFGLNQ